MPALVAGIHVLAALPDEKTWMAGTSPAMTSDCVARCCPFSARPRTRVRLRRPECRLQRGPSAGFPLPASPKRSRFAGECAGM